MKDALVLLSGGLDSAVTLAKVVKMYGPNQVGALSFNYAQRHEKELFYANSIAVKYAVKHLTFDTRAIYQDFRGPLFKRDNDLTLPTGEYNPDELPATNIPFRNGIFLSIATAMAMEFEYRQVVIAAHQNDFNCDHDAGRPAYPDCSLDFINHIGCAIRLGTGDRVSLWTPFINSTKAEIVKEGVELGVDFSMTWSCYAGGDKPCGECSTCVDRRKAFEENGLEPQ